MAYSYYQRSGQPNWGTSQFQFGRPPTPSFQPQPSWGGNDFYRAHAATADPYLFDQAWDRVREYGGAPTGGIGVGLHEARIWHRRAYGANEASFMAPEEIGHAAAYEAYRTWIHNSAIYEPLSGDIERQREALTGLAVAEATRLLAFSNRPIDQYSRLTATEAAAHTASYIFYQTQNEEYKSRSRYRRGSMDDPYAYDDELLYPRSRSRSRHRSVSRARSFSGSPMAYSGSAYSPSASGMSPSGFPGSYAGSYAGSNMPMPLTGSAYGSPSGIPMAGSAYGASMPPMGLSQPPYSAPIGMGVSPSYQGGLGVPTGMGYSRSRSSSFSYPQQYAAQQYPQQYGMQQPYMGTATSMPATMPGQGQMIVIHKQKKHHKHRSHNRRSRSSDGEYDRY